MSRIGKKLIPIPKETEIKINNNNITVKGPKGNLNWNFPSTMKVENKDNNLIIERMNDSKKEKALHGLTRSLINNMVTGVSHGFTRDLELVGVGYKAQVNGNDLEFNIGYSHTVKYSLPKGISAEIDKKQTKLTLSGIDKQLLGQTAANIRSIRPPDAYKGKGIRYSDEYIKLKPGKTSAK